MPVLGEVELVELTLPYSKAKITVNKNITHSDVAGAQREDRDPLESQKFTFLAVVKSWDFTNKDGSSSPITMENIALLNYVDVEFVNEWVKDHFASLRKKEALTEDETLKSSSTSGTSIPVN